MEYRNLGKAGLKVSAVGLGCNQFGGVVDKEGTKAIVYQALDIGINFFDTADVYNKGVSEEYLGAALQGLHDRVIIATKVRHAMGDGPNDQGTSRYHIIHGVEASLRRLGTDHIDLYQIHTWYETVPIEETMRALDDLVRQGKVLHIGASNFSAWQLSHSNDIAKWMGWEQFVTIQPHYHMLEREIEHELVPYCHYAGVGILPYFPLAGGILTGKYKRGQAAPTGSRGERSPYVQKYLADETTFDKIEKLTTFATAHRHTLHELAFAWLLANEHVSSVIAGATKLEQVVANAATIDWKLTPDEITKVNELL